MIKNPFPMGIVRNPIIYSLYNSLSSESEPTPPPVQNFLISESDDQLISEDGDLLIAE